MARVGGLGPDFEGSPKAAIVSAQRRSKGATPERFVLFRIEVTIVKASNIQAADLGGKSDPYVVLTIGEFTVRRLTLASLLSESDGLAIDECSMVFDVEDRGCLTS